MKAKIVHTLAFGDILPTTGRIRDFNPLETCAARRTSKKVYRIEVFCLITIRLHV